MHFEKRMNFGSTNPQNWLLLSQRHSWRLWKVGEVTILKTAFLARGEPKQSNSTSALWELRLSTRVAAEESAHYSLMLGVVSVYQCWHLRLSGAVCSAVTEAVMTDWTKLIYFFIFLISVQLNSACVLRFYQIRASLKVPPRFPHKVETSLLHPGGKITEVVLSWMWFEFSSGDFTHSKWLRQPNKGYR